MAVSDAFSSFFDAVGNLFFGYSDQEKEDIQQAQEDIQTAKETDAPSNSEFDTIRALDGLGISLQDGLTIGLVFIIFIFFLRD